jgi:ferredoxin
MSSITKKWIAVLLAVWLPLFTGNALAASFWMQMPHDACDTMQQMDDCDQMMSDVPAQAGDDQQDSACTDCGLCHLACSAYLSMPEIKTPGLPDSGITLTPYHFSFQSINAIPLLPPPLSRA